ncbi:MAG: OB-fold nucleic acid binding domain-containing protein [Candidatus Moraniibacteriota bacterium]
MLVSEATVSDGTGDLRIVWFNQRYIGQTVKAGATLRLSGKVTKDRQGLVMTNPETERAGRDATHTARLVPVYPETRGLSSRFLRWQITELFPEVSLDADPIPAENSRNACTCRRLPKHSAICISPARSTKWCSPKSA